MPLFFITFFALYGGLHLYAFLKARAAFGFGLRAGAALALPMALMVLAPVLVRVSEKAGYEQSARLLSIAAYSWMGLLFLFCSFSFALD